MDQLSSFPDAILLHILSFVDLHSLVRTSILSRRWRHLWESASDLDFNSFPDGIIGRRPIWPDDFIDRALALRENSKIRKFRISIPHDAFPSERVDSWITLLAGCGGVEELNLDIRPPSDDEVEGTTVKYEVPQCVFNFKSLTSLSLRHCKLHLPTPMWLPNLKTLYLRMIDLNDEVIKDLVSGCPLLEDLTLHGCNMFNELNIALESSRLKSLKLVEWDFYCGTPKLEIFAPNLLTLEFVDHMTRPSYVVKNLRSLVVASFNFDRFLEISEYDTTNFVEIFDQIRHVKVLKLCSGCIVELSLREMEGSSTAVPFSVLTLELKTGFCKFELPGLTYMLKKFINLEVLNIDVVDEDESDKFEYHFEDSGFDEAEHWMLLETSFVQSLQHIKTVKILGIFVKSQYVTQETKGGVVEDIESQKKLITGKAKEKVVEGILKEEGFITELIKIMLKNSARMQMQATKYGRDYVNLVFIF